MGKYLELAKQIPRRQPVVQSIPDDVAAVQTSKSAQRSWQHDSIDRLVQDGAGYIQISRKGEEVYIALTDSEFHDLSQRPGIMVYHAAH